MNQKQNVFFGPPLAQLTVDQNNTLEVSGRLNRTAERYLAIINHHGIALDVAEKECLKTISMIGHMSIDEIDNIANDVELFTGAIENLDKEVLVAKLKSASLADLIATIDQLGC